MSGKRQHYIPQFFMRNFSYQKTKKEHYLLQYRKDGGVFTCNTKNTGAEGFFYSLGSDHSIDDSITDLENELAEIVSVLHENKSSDLSSLDLPKLISHLEIRTRNLRQSFFNSSDYFLKKISKIFFEKDVLIRYFIRNVMGDKEVFHSLIDKQLDGTSVSASQRSNLKEVIAERCHEWLPPVAEEFVSIIKPLWDERIKKELDLIIKNGHINALTMSLHPSLKAEMYKALKFKRIETDFLLPLGDSIVLFEVNDSRGFKPFLEKNDELKAVYLPVSPRCLLYGSYHDDTPDLLDLDLHVSQCSLEFFIASEKSARNDFIQREIGKSAFAISNVEIDNIMDDLMRNNSFLHADEL